MKFKGYKNFSNNHFVGLDDIKNVNVIIGKNNIGKTALLESVKAQESLKTLASFGFNTEDIAFYYRLNEKDIDGIINVNSLLVNKSGSITGYYDRGYYHFNRKDFEFLVDKKVKFTLDDSFFNGKQNIVRHPQKLELECYGTFFSKNEKHKELLNSYLNGFIYSIIPKEMKKEVVELSADRDLKPEPPTNVLQVNPDGTGATNIIQNYLNKADKDSNVVEVDMLNALNRIMMNDIEFSRISIQDVSRDEDESQLWEIFLHEKGKPPISLSDSGSGLRTVLLVLIKLLLECNTEKTHIVIFEELENNLHPAIQRNLHRYIFEWAKKYEQFVFITTHSNVPIDMVLQEEKAQLVHVFKKDNLVYTATLLSSLDSDNIFNDLEIKASDLLQSNGIIWVEGPSDRIYINKWIELITDGALVENKHYQIMFYGGKLLSHLSGNTNFEKLTDYEETNLINLLLTNRNAAIVIDSDRSKPKKHINQTKKRIKKEFENNDKFVWITEGREIENYLSENTLGSKYTVTRQIGKYENIGDYLIEQGNKDNYSTSKPDKARKLIEFMDKSDLEILDLKSKLEKLVNTIKCWNNL
nr:AAA family ATPase [Salinicoccus sediminis]